MKLRSSKQILRLSPKTMARIIAQQQVTIAEHEQEWSRGGDPDDWDEYDDQLARAKLIASKLRAKPKRDKEDEDEEDESTHKEGKDEDENEDGATVIKDECPDCVMFYPCKKHRGRK